MTEGQKERLTRSQTARKASVIPGLTRMINASLRVGSGRHSTCDIDPASTGHPSSSADAPPRKVIDCPADKT